MEVNEHNPVTAIVCMKF